MKPIIAIPAQRTTGQEEDGYASACRHFYISSIFEAGGVPIILPLGLSEDEWQVVYQISNGILITGGSDVDPSLYNEPPHPKLGEILPERDRLETWIVKRAFLDNKPLLGICRGVQIMNVALGGTLYQDIPEQFPSDVLHRSTSKEKWIERPHTLQIDPNSKLSKILSSDNCLINSLHHQGIKDLAQGLCVSARSPDGLIEAVEGTEKTFFLGIQGHPEALWQSIDTKWLELFKAFVSSCK